MGSNNTTTGAGAQKLTADGPGLREEFQGAYRYHADAVYGVARGICGVRVAADVTREVFLRLWRHPEDHQPAQLAMRTSLLKATHNVAVDTNRAQTRRAERAGARPGADVGQIVQDPASTDRRSFGARPLGILSDDEREVIVTVLHGGCTYRAAAVALGLEEGTVKRRIREGLQRLRVAMPPRASTSPQDIGERDARRRFASDQGLALELDAREVVAQAQGIIMEHEGSTSGEAYSELLRLSERLGMTLPACAEVFVASAHDGALVSCGTRADRHRGAPSIEGCDICGQALIGCRRCSPAPGGIFTRGHHPQRRPHRRPGVSARRSADGQ